MGWFASLHHDHMHEVADPPPAEPRSAGTNSLLECAYGKGLTARRYRSTCVYQSVGSDTLLHLQLTTLDLHLFYRGASQSSTAWADIMVRYRSAPRLPEKVWCPEQPTILCAQHGRKHEESELQQPMILCTTRQNIRQAQSLLVAKGSFIVELSLTSAKAARPWNWHLLLCFATEICSCTFIAKKSK